MAKKALIKVVEVPPAPSGVLANDHIPRVFPQTRLSVNDKGDNEVLPRAAHKPPGIYLKAEENFRKTQLGVLR